VLALRNGFFLDITLESSLASLLLSFLLVLVLGPDFILKFWICSIKELAPPLISCY